MLSSIWNELFPWLKEWRVSHGIDLSDPVDSRAFFAAVRAKAHLLLLQQHGLSAEHMETTFPFITCGRREDGTYYVAWMDEVITFALEEETECE